MATLVVGESIWAMLGSKVGAKEIRGDLEKSVASKADLAKRYTVKIVSDEAYAKIMADMFKVTGSKPKDEREKKNKGDE